MSPEVDNTKKRLPPNAGKGRPPGALNKATKAIREMSAKLLEDKSYQAGLKKRLKSGKAPHMEVLLHHYAYGKPRETLKHEGTAPAPLIVTRVNTKAEINALLGSADADAGPELDDHES